MLKVIQGLDENTVCRSATLFREQQIAIDDHTEFKLRGIFNYIVYLHACNGVQNNFSTLLISQLKAVIPGRVETNLSRQKYHQHSSNDGSRVALCHRAE